MLGSSFEKRIVLIFCIWGCACGPLVPISQEMRDEEEGLSKGAILIATERSQRGGRLVVVDAEGARLDILTSLPVNEKTIDRSPVVARNRKWVFFSSNRERSALSKTNLWAVSLTGGQPFALTPGPHIDRDPRVSPDGAWLYFCSDRNGSFDLYRGRIPQKMGPLFSIQQLTFMDESVLSPSLSPDGTSVVFMAAEKNGRSRLWRMAAKRYVVAKRISDGPTDLTPSWGRHNRIAFSAPASGRLDTDLYLIDAEGGNRRAVLDSPETDEMGPRWSSDGRYLFSVGTYRSVKNGTPLLGSIVFVDLEEKDRKLRVLHDPSTVESRIGLALLGQPLDASVLHSNALYVQALHDLFLNEYLKKKQDASNP